RDRRRVDAQLRVVGRAPDHLLPPVAEDVGTQAGRRLGAVVRRTAVGPQEDGFGFLLPLPFADRGPVEQLAQQVAVPPDAEVARPRFPLRHLLALAVPHTAQARAGRPTLDAGVARVDVHRHAAGHVGGWLAPEDLAGAGVPERDADVLGRLLVDVEHF